VGELSVEVIIPVQNMAGQLEAVLVPAIAQRQAGDVVTVVDDASTDDTAAVARALGAEVIRLSASQGPYYARQVAAHRSQADVLLFIDARCRPLPGLLDAHRALQAKPEVALSCTEVRTLSGPSLAARVAELQQPFSLHGRIGVRGRPDYFPTCNLGIARAAFEAVGGFRAMRSGGDADICWRVQDQGLGTMAADPRPLMEWQPRTSMRDLASQYRRYGGSTAYLNWVYDHSPAPYGPGESPLAALKSELARRRAVRRPTPVEELARIGIDAAFQYGLLEARFQRSRFVAPVRYEVDDGAESAEH
jgi:glycosyltransferase involved in cell wall biosynthesis